MSMRRIADSTVRRLSLYLRFLEDFEHRGHATVSSESLATRGGTTSAQVRKDLSFFGSFGKRGLGYPVADLAGKLRDILGLNRRYRLAVVGAGKIGSALVLYRGFRQRGFDIVAIFDSDAAKIGREFEGMAVRDAERIEEYLTADPVDMGVIVVPGDQAQVVAAAARGHRTFLLADEPGLGKTAQALLAAQAADAYPLLVVVPNVVKTNWAREVGLWTPRRSATVIHGDGDTIDGFADIVIVNYEVLDRHVGWLGDLGFRGMVVDEAHFIKNKSSQRSQHVLEISQRIRNRIGRPLLMALTGTPLINDLEDFLAIWAFLGWIDETKPRGELMAALEDTGLVPGDRGFYPAARRCVIDMGIVRRRKIKAA